MTLFNNDLSCSGMTMLSLCHDFSCREASMQKAKKTNVMRGRDMVSPIDARDYEPVEGSWVRPGS